jgi:hypothetical protein
MVEPDKIDNPSADPHKLNLRLANVILAHVFRQSKTNKRDFPIVDFQRSKLVMDGFSTFNALRDNDLSTQNPEVYGKLLEKPSLGLLARLVDITQYGLEGPLSEKELAPLDPSVFYVYDLSRGKTEYDMIGTAAKQIYSPLADLLGYSRLAGNLCEIYYQNVDPQTHAEVARMLLTLHDRIENTRLVAGSVISDLRHFLDGADFKYTIKMRPGKHPGKVMEKVDRFKREKGQHIYTTVNELNDLVAFTVVLHSCKGNPIDQNDLDTYAMVARMILKITMRHEHVDQVPESKIFTDHITNPKPNGYQSFHADIPLSGDLVNMEAIVRNTRMEEYARSGGAAHYLYKGGGGLAKRVAAAYRDVKKAITRNRNGTGRSANSQRKIHIYLPDEAKPLERVVDNNACVGEALMCADFPLTEGMVFQPRISLLAPIDGVEEIRLESARSEQRISRGMVELLLQKAIYNPVREKLQTWKKEAKH